MPFLIPNSAIASATLTYHYDTFGRLQDTHLSPGIDATYYYSHYNALTELAYYQGSPDAHKILRLTYRYNRSGMLQQRIRTNATGAQAIENYGYNRRNNLQDYHCSGALCPQDAQGNTITFQHYLFDAFDNIQHVTSNNGSVTYYYDTLLPTRLTFYQTQEASSHTTHIFEYDHDGNILRDANENLISYTPLDETQTVSNPQGITRYLYDGQGIQVGEHTPNNTTTYFLYGQQNLLTTKTNGHTTSFLYGLTRFGSDTGQTLRYYLIDQKQSVIGSVASSSESTPLITQYAYSPYGVETTRSIATQRPDIPQHVGFNGQLTDDQTHWQFLGKGYHRAYDPELRRFLHQDSLSPFGKGDINGYHFAKNNPVMNTDSNGHFALTLLYAGLIAATVAMSLKNIITGHNTEIQWATLAFGMLAPFFCVTGSTLEGAEFIGETLEGVSTGVSMELGQIQGKKGRQTFGQMDASDWGGLVFAAATGVASGFALGEALESFKDFGYYGGAATTEGFITEKATWETLDTSIKQTTRTWNTNNLAQGMIRSGLVNGSANAVYSSTLNLYNKFVGNSNTTANTLLNNAWQDFGFGTVMGAIQPVSFHIQNHYQASSTFQNTGYLMSGAVNGVLPYSIAWLQGML